MEIISTLFNVETHFGAFTAIFGCQIHCAVHYLSKVPQQLVNLNQNKRKLFFMTIYRYRHKTIMVSISNLPPEYS